MDKNLEHYEDEISLKELILVLIKYWKIIAGCILAFGLVAFVYLYFVAKPVYESTIDGIISIPEVTDTRYGEYPFPTQNPSDYLEVVFSDKIIRKVMTDFEIEGTIKGYKDYVSIKQEEDASRFAFSLKEGSPEQAKEILEVLSKLYLQEVNYQYKLNALSYFERLHHTNLNKIDASRETISKTLVEYEKLLEGMEQKIPLKKLILSDPVYATQLAKDKSINLENLNDSVMLEEYINPNYEALESQITDLRKNYAALDIQESMYQNYLNEIQAERAMVSKFLLGGQDTKMKEGLLEVLRPYVLISEEADLPEGPISPRKMMGLAIALVLGGMTGVFVALFMAYWKKEAN